MVGEAEIDDASPETDLAKSAIAKLGERYEGGFLLEKSGMKKKSKDGFYEIAGKDIYGYYGSYGDYLRSGSLVILQGIGKNENRLVSS